MCYMTQDKEQQDAPYWSIIAEHAGGLTPPGSTLKHPALASHVQGLHAYTQTDAPALHCNLLCTLG